MKTFAGSTLRLMICLVAYAAFALSARAVIFTTDTTISSTDTTYEGLDIVVTNCVLTVDGPHSFASLQLLRGATLTHTTNLSGLNLTIAGGAVITPDGTINVNGRGHGPGSGPGAGSSLQGNPASGGGAGHGGYGGLGSSNIFPRLGGGTYGSVLQPADKGSGGGRGLGGLGGSGGGAIKMTVGGTLRMDGSIWANGANATNSRAGGGSGGSVWLSAQTVSGTGLISANGGDGEPMHGGGGAGGRIAIYVTTNTFTGNFSAPGGAGFMPGGAGTVYNRDNSRSAGQLVVDNGGRAGADTPVTAPERFDLTVRGGAIASASTLTVANLQIASDAFVFSSSWAFPGDPSPLSLTVTGNAVIDVGGGILVDGLGTRFGIGSGSSTNAGNVIGYVGSGGGHGGYGGAGGLGPLGGATHGSLTGPRDLGAAGGGGGGIGRDPGGAGGGVINMTVNGTLTVNGRISANGLFSAVPNSGGGSGGSVWITAGRLDGSGVIFANGGAGNSLGGGGGGGRIVLQYNTKDFSGLVSAYGGVGGGGAGGAGTIYRSIGQFPEIIADNGGNRGTNTTLTLQIPNVDLTVTGGASLVWPSSGSFTFRNLLIGSNSVLIATNAQAITLSVQSNATIQAGGWLKGDGEGSSPAQQGNGGVATSPIYGNTGGGGGHGGNGSPSLAGAAGGFAPFGIATQPTMRGGNGAPIATSGPLQGGAGGAAIRLNVTGTLQLDGKLSADGHDGNALHSGGGAGGSLWIAAGRLAGSGVISANGGNGNSVGGSGGGGRIAIHYGSNLFSGTITAHGGSGVNAGGAGTIYLQRSGPALPLPQLVLDNDGRIGAPSILPTSVPSPVELTLREGVVATVNNVLPAIRTLFIGSNAWLVVTNLSSLNVSSNATIEAGGGITADGTGSASGQGQGAGRAMSTPSGPSGSGGGHGGEGGNSGGGAIGGFAYDSVTSPNFPGSGGGAGSGTGTNAFGGRGGGIIRMTVSGTFRLDGSVSAEGTAGIGLNSGGGSGGSVSLTVGTLAGSGRISASGGAGNGPAGAGGGGGRIAISFIRSNSFAGAVSAFGGSGFVGGGAGTIYYSRLPGSQFSHLAVVNGGEQGALSPLLGLSSGSNPDLTIQGGAIVPLLQLPGIHNLFIGSNSWLVVSNLVTANISGDVLIEAGGGINADGPAYGTGQGLGAGRAFGSPVYGQTGSGGGHGGFGGASRAGAAGGNVYDSITTAAMPGSDGGGSPVQTGGGGGRAIRLSLSRGNLHLEGKISADGRAGNQHGGGGSGGSVLLEVGTLTGTGTISANGGAGSGVGGGGGGGRIAISSTSNGFAGVVTARGGPGGSAAGGWGAGGAGTIYTRTGSQSLGQVLVENGGLFGTNTPLADIGVFNLTVAGGATASSADSSLTLSNLFVNRDGLVTGGAAQTNLHLAVLSNAVVAAGGAIAVDGLGFAQGNGPGRGFSAFGFGGGGGHGGAGGDSMTAPGGESYGSATHPVDRGSGGGFGAGPLYGGSQGGGALRLSVGGTLTVDGWLSANGSPGFQDGAGGGAGGSIWVNARTLRGNGFISADGGDGELFGGGGGGGGRIAVYYLTNPGHTNNFTGELTAYGGLGYFWGDDGSVFYSSGVETLAGVAHTPSGTVSNAVSSVDVVFNTALSPFAASGTDATLTTPTGPLSAGSLTVSQFNPSGLRISFPTKSAPGDYSFTLGPAIEDLYGRPMAQAYAGTFTIAPPTIRGRIADTNGLPVPGVVLQASGGSTDTVTGAAGDYALSFAFGSAFTVTPTLGGFTFEPGFRSYTNVTAFLTDQDFVLIGSVAPALSGIREGTNFLARWHGLPGMIYRVYCSTNLMDWQPCSEPMTGSNALLQIPLPVDGAPKKFFRVRVGN